MIINYLIPSRNVKRGIKCSIILPPSPQNLIQHIGSVAQLVERGARINGKDLFFEQVLSRFRSFPIGWGIKKFYLKKNGDDYRGGVVPEPPEGPLKSFFFRAEDFSDYINNLRQNTNRNNAFLEDMRGEVDDSVLDKMSESMNTTLHAMRRDYGESLLAFSHGEGYLKIMETRISSNGIYLLDEPEAALSPLKQLSLIFFIQEALQSNHSQFIIATHSPIIMGIPGARIYEINEEEIRQVAYEETEHYRITYSFLKNPASYLRHL